MQAKITVFICVSLWMNVVLGDDMQDLINMLHSTCMTETGATEDVISRAQKGDFADDENLKCYMKCLMDQMACVSDDGIVDVDGVVALLPDDARNNMEPTIRKCGTKVGASPCENVWLTNKCYFEGSPKHYFLP